MEHPTATKTKLSEGFIDGDLVERFLDLSEAKMQEICKGIKVCYVCQFACKKQCKIYILCIFLYCKNIIRHLIIHNFCYNYTYTVLHSHIVHIGVSTLGTECTLNACSISIDYIRTRNIEVPKQIECALSQSTAVCGLNVI